MFTTAKKGFRPNFNSYQINNNLDVIPTKFHRTKYNLKWKKLKINQGLHPKMKQRGLEIRCNFFSSGFEKNK